MQDITSENIEDWHMDLERKARKAFEDWLRAYKRSSKSTSPINSSKGFNE